jgi:hypothetical protein
MSRRTVQNQNRFVAFVELLEGIAEEFKVGSIISVKIVSAKFTEMIEVSSCVF